ncbi:MAG: alanine--tRNA ligase [Actinomycetales bacterium]|nr:alanine--tRNA ligase [Actinomycetales bacterium]
MESAEIRRRFLDFFAARGHTVVPSASLIANDPTLLLVNAGMVPFKPYFLGEVPAPYPRATSVQKCVRTLDIDEVGRTTRHASFFQMAGNFSFGDYFKAGAIAFAWELLTSPVAGGGYGFDPGVLWVTVFDNDDESASIWRDQVGVPAQRIQRRGMADNYWSMGVPGPCGPCSEIYVDRGEQYGRPGGPIADEERYLEVWNLVFMQQQRGAGGGKEDFPILGELPAKNIDTGMGLERMAALLQGVDNIYEIDTTRLILDRACALTGVAYGAAPVDDVRLRVVADHARTTVFLVGDGVVPGNEGRGYVVRRMARRVIRMMRLLGAEQPVIGDLLDSVVEAMGPQYPELAAERDRIHEVLTGEEAAFRETLRTGTVLFDAAVREMRAAGGVTLAGARAFELHDTYGFPIDLTREMAAEQGCSVDEEQFTQLMAAQRERAKADARTRKVGAAGTSYRELLDIGAMGRPGADSPVSTFTGYDTLTESTVVRGLLRDGRPVTEVLPDEGSLVEVVLERTPFYAEAGGQLADTGWIRAAGGALQVQDVQSPVPGLIIHRARLVDGRIALGEEVTGEVDAVRRAAISSAHTATHLVHKAFRESLGQTATQVGSENSPGRLRFDFPSPRPVSGGLLAEVAARVNEVLITDLPVTVTEMPLADARAMGAMALFGEKYGDRVRVVSIGDYSHELCGGTHVQRSGELGLVTFLSEQSIGAGTRRVEALVGGAAYQRAVRDHALVGELRSLLKGRPEELPDRVSALVERVRTLERELAARERATLQAQAPQLARGARAFGPVAAVLTTVNPGVPADGLRELALAVRAAVGGSASLVGLLSPATGTEDQGAGRMAAVVVATPAAVAVGVSAAETLRWLLADLGGRGGGSAEIAQGAAPAVTAEAVTRALRATEERLAAATS